MEVSSVLCVLALFFMVHCLINQEARTLEGEGLQLRHGGTEAIWMWFKVTWVMFSTNPALVWLAFILTWVFHRLYRAWNRCLPKAFMERGTQTEGLGMQHAQVPPFYQNMSGEDYAHRLVRISGELEDFARMVQGKVRKGLGHLEEITYIMEGLEDVTTRVRGEMREITGQGKATGVKPQSRPAGAQPTSRAQGEKGDLKKYPAFELLQQEKAAVQRQEVPTAQGLRRSPRNHAR
ncbi:uncharacterized protein LOC121916101 [Sceloporus undulatus]|uniref:uncharacterized protein LOC121916101 n=1 Tax=Sceloporus undulatus TaxID=8520 RepID=UPI001C4D217B|nr:uncharacterized protein LOC121916101 [Sceloporus undulatus]